MLAMCILSIFLTDKNSSTVLHLPPIRNNGFAWFCYLELES
jgi:hypothetical protein